MRIVLVPGAWHGGWCWNAVTPLLQAAGHKVAIDSDHSPFASHLETLAKLILEIAAELAPGSG